MRRAVAVLIVLVTAGCGGTSTASLPPGAIAVVGSRVITRADFDAQMDQSRRSYAARGLDFPAVGTAAYGHLKDIAVGLLVERARLELAAEHLGIVVSFAQVERRLARIRQETFGGSERRYREGLRRQGMTDAEIRDAIRVDLLAEAMRTRMTGKPGGPPRTAYAPGFAPADGG